VLWAVDVAKSVCDVQIRAVSRAADNTAKSAEKPTIIFTGFPGRKLHDHNGCAPPLAPHPFAPMNQPIVGTHSQPELRLTVLDTQAVLDWLYFSDPVTLHWEAWRQAGQWQWVAGVAMRDELGYVLGRGGLPAGKGMAAQALMDAFDARARILHEPAPTLAPPLRCTDPDDQKFIDFAVAHHTTWLVSRDRAVLKLKRRALVAHGVHILPPAAWAPAEAP